jgi:hypothetical protein
VPDLRPPHHTISGNPDYNPSSGNTDYNAPTPVSAMFQVGLQTQEVKGRRTGTVLCLQIRFIIQFSHVVSSKRISVFFLNF